MSLSEVSGKEKFGPSDKDRVPLDKFEGFVKAQFFCAVREHRDLSQRG
jgi:hypothetical protein